MAGTIVLHPCASCGEPVKAKDLVLCPACDAGSAIYDVCNEKIAGGATSGMLSDATIAEWIAEPVAIVERRHRHGFSMEQRAALIADFRAQILEMDGQIRQ